MRQHTMDLSLIHSSISALSNARQLQFQLSDKISPIPALNLVTAQQIPGPKLQYPRGSA